MQLFIQINHFYIEADDQNLQAEQKSADFTFRVFWWDLLHIQSDVWNWKSVAGDAR